jgi:hypothetical protein
VCPFGKFARLKIAVAQKLTTLVAKKLAPKAGTQQAIQSHFLNSAGTTWDKEHQVGGQTGEEGSCLWQGQLHL